MLILVAVTITIAVNGGLFNYARRAVKETENAKQEEQLLASGKIKIDDKWYDSMDDYIKGIVSGTERFSEIKTANYEYTDSNNVTVTIPAGFAYGTSAGINTVAGGLVITDGVDENGVSTGNEFVWIPVKDGEFTRTGWWNNAPTTDSLEDITDGWDEDDYKYYIALSYGYNSIEDMIDGMEYNDYASLLDSEWGGSGLEDTIAWFNDCYGWAGALDTENYTESIPSDLTDSVSDYGGFYLARYEAGSTTARTNSSGATTMVVQKESYPYNWINWNDAKAKSEAMYEDSDSVVSTLCYGAQWDCALKFIRDKVNVTNSTTWGNYCNHEFKFTGEYSTDGRTNWTSATNMTKPIASDDNDWISYLLTTGASGANTAKNIYDLAGNVCEWTMEAGSPSYRVDRGGYYSSSGSGNPASYRNYNNPTGSIYYVGFRVALYIS